MLQIDDHGIILKAGEPPIPWSDLKKASIVTLSTGPLDDDVFFVLETSLGKHMVSHSDPSSKDLLVALQRLSGFDNDSFIASMGSTADQEFPLWTAPEASSAGMHEEES